jgi:hypothetical protein
MGICNTKKCCDEPDVDTVFRVVLPADSTDSIMLIYIFDRASNSNEQIKNVRICIQQFQTLLYIIVDLLTKYTIILLKIKEIKFRDLPLCI